MGVTFTKQAAERIANVVRTVERRPVSVGSRYAYTSKDYHPPHDFDPRFDGINIYRTAGNRCVIGFNGNAWESVTTEAGPYTGNGTCWMKWTQTTDTLDGEWTEGYGTPPDQDETCTVFKLWSVEDGAVTYHERGAKRAIDWGNC